MGHLCRALRLCCSAYVLPQSEQTLLFDAMKSELLEKIRRLEEDRQSINLTCGRPLHHVTPITAEVEA